MQREAFFELIGGSRESRELLELLKQVERGEIAKGEGARRAFGVRSETLAVAAQ